MGSREAKKYRSIRWKPRWEEFVITRDFCRVMIISMTELGNGN